MLSVSSLNQESILNLVKALQVAGEATFPDPFFRTWTPTTLYTGMGNRILFKLQRQCDPKSSKFEEIITFSSVNH